MDRNSEQTILYIDLETYSSVDLKKAGMYRYAESEDFEILLLAYAWGDGDVYVVDFKQHNFLIPEGLLEALFSPNVKKSAFNAAFERVCLSRHFGRETPPEQWSCTAMLSRSVGLPGSLEKCGKVLGLSDQTQKLDTGSSLISFFCKPCTPTTRNEHRSRNLPQHEPEKWRDFMEYNRRDVEAERTIRTQLTTFFHAPSEQRLWEIDQRINDRGVQVDLDLAEKADQYAKQLKQSTKEEAFLLTGLSNPNSIAQLKQWIEENTGQEVSSLNKKDVADWKSSITDENVLRMLELRNGMSKSSLEKYSAMTRCTMSDGRARGVTLFYGASRTGRWAGRLVQMQNLPQNKMSDLHLDHARILLKMGSYEGLSMIFDDVPDTLSQLIRTAFIPKEGCEFVVADFSSIEARVLAWLASEKWRQEVFATHGKIYESSAEQMFGLEKGTVTKGHPLRNTGKVAELALGYGGSAGALIAMGALKIGLKEEELAPLVARWRKASPNITKLWRDVETAAKQALQEKRVAILPHGMRFYMEGFLLKCKLPSGRELAYAYPRIEQGNISYFDDNKKAGRDRTYGAKLVENIVQAIARDCLAEAMVKLDQEEIPIVFHVHDEVICEVPKNQRDYTKEVGEIMSLPIPWAQGLILTAEGYRCNYYKKD